MAEILKKDDFKRVVIDTIMGHFMTGNEFFGKFSSISFQKMAININEELSKIQLTIGFKAIASEI